ncbi:MAG: hypothetical protein IID33_15150 [Planctomycetes bacterium]|nr:hypothetical protein [Planctomycetota bacterium]
MNKVVFFAVVAACLGDAVRPAMAQDDNVPPQIINTSWFVLRNLDGKLDTYEDGTFFGYDPDGYQAFEPTVDRAREFDLLRVAITISDPDFVDDEGEATDEEVFLALNAHFTPLQGYPTPVGPPLSASVVAFFGGFGPQGVPTTTITVTVFNIVAPPFIGKNQAKLRGLIDWDVRYNIVLAVSNEENPESWTPGDEDNPLFCGFFVFVDDSVTHVFCELLHIVENPAAGPPNAPPFADAGADQIVASGTTVDLDGSGTFDSFNIGFNPELPGVFEKDNITFVWEWISGPERVDPIARDPARPAVAEVTLNDLGTYVYRLITDDGVNALPTTDSMVVEVVTSIPENRAPIALTAGPTGLVTLGEVITLDGTGSFDPDGDPLGFLWQQTDELGGRIPTSEIGKVFQPLAGLDTPVSRWQSTKAGIFHFRLLVNDGEFVDSTRISVEVIEAATAGFTVVQPDAALPDTQADADASTEAAPAQPTGNQFAPLCGGGLLPIMMVPFAMFFMRGRRRG